MAKSQQTQKPIVPNFTDHDKEATKRAQAALAGGRQAPLKVPKSAKSSKDKNGVTYSRWTERVVITGAYRTVTESGLMDVVITAKIRQSENAGSSAWGHFYKTIGAPVKDGHEQMNDRSLGAIVTLLQATGFMPGGGALKGTLLDKMFPIKNQPGASSPLQDKAVIASIVQTFGPQKDRQTRKPVLDAEGEPIMERRDAIESFLVDAPEADEDEAGEDE